MPVYGTFDKLQVAVYIIILQIVPNWHFVDIPECVRNSGKSLCVQIMMEYKCFVRWLVDDCQAGEVGAAEASPGAWEFVHSLRW